MLLDEEREGFKINVCALGLDAWTNRARRAVVQAKKEFDRRLNIMLSFMSKVV